MGGNIYDPRTGNMPGASDILAETQAESDRQQYQYPPGIDPATLQIIRSYMDPDQFDILIRAQYKQGSLITVPFSVGAIAPAPLQLLPKQENRNYLFILNTSAANRLFIGFGYAPNANTGIIIELNLGFYEPNVVPNQEIWALGAGAGTTGILIYSTR